MSLVKAIAKYIAEERSPAEYREIVKDFGTDQKLINQLILTLAVEHNISIRNFHIDDLSEMPAPMFGLAFPASSFDVAFLSSGDAYAKLVKTVYQM